MSAVVLDQAVPDVAFEATGGIKEKLSDLRGKTVVLYFYPKDSTPGCTMESKAFRDHYRDFIAANAVIYGISRDSLVSHEKFKEKQELPFELIADTDDKLCQLFDVIKEKSFFGKKIIGIQRSTFLIDAQGVLRQVWRKVKVSGHVLDVLTAVQQLAQR